jgi:hypothetical protein
MVTALLREPQYHSSVAQPTVTIPNELSWFQKYAVRNEITSKSRDTHARAHVPYLVWRKSYEADEECYCFLQQMFRFRKSACKQFGAVTIKLPHVTYASSRQGGFNKENLRED